MEREYRAVQVSRVVYLSSKPTKIKIALRDGVWTVTGPQFRSKSGALNYAKCKSLDHAKAIVEEIDNGMSIEDVIGRVDE